ncbi:MAG: hypothetical protein V3U93_07450 [Alphaproteobacteria bacterium]
MIEINRHGDKSLFAPDRKERFRLAFNPHQRIIQIREGERWATRKFLTDKRGLYRAMAALKCHPTKQARATIDSWPQHFKVWLLQVLRGQREAILMGAASTKRPTNDSPTPPEVIFPRSEAA